MAAVDWTRPIVGTPPFDARAIVATVASWEDVATTRVRIQQRLKAIEKAGVAPPPELVLIHAHLENAEKLAKKQILREWRKHPLSPWARTVHGLGEHSAAVLLAHLNGDPLVAYPKRWVGRELIEGEPFMRRVSDLWSYCGVGAPRQRTKGMTRDELLACGRPQLRARLFLITESFIIKGNPRYRDVYDAARAKYDSRDWTDGHRKAAALRYVAKVFLADLYDVARAKKGT